MSKSKIAYEMKVEIVRDYLNGKVGYTESVRRANNSMSIFRQWVEQYKTGGAEALLPQSKNNSYSTETKLIAVRQYLAGKGSMEKICKKVIAK